MALSAEQIWQGVGARLKVTTRLMVSYFNWMWENSRLGNTAALIAGLASQSRTWDDQATFPTLAWRTTWRFKW